jgi:hypothetical protein
MGVIDMMGLMQAALAMRQHNSATTDATLDVDVGSAMSESIRRGQPAVGD